ncbi:MAG: hypothetical protein M3P26_06715 [Gemmatimonadota bacterium]|nr:hypothetical protein [Gemmatimonadota bacterium]
MAERIDPPGRTKGDAAHAIAKAAIGSLPVVGAAGAELFAYVVQAPYERRREAWMREIGDEISDLRDNAGIDVEKLRDDPAFTDTVLSATQAALRTRSESKRRALRNAVRNAAKPSAPEEGVRLTFIRLVDELTEWHLGLLDLFRDPAKWFGSHEAPPANLSMGAPSAVVEAAFPMLRGRRDLYDQWWRDLHVRGLVTIDHLHTTMTGQGMMSPRLTPLGNQFVVFIQNQDAPPG